MEASFRKKSKKIICMTRISEMKKVCVVTGSRAEYGLLKKLLVLMKKDKTLNTQLIVTGSHLSKKHGLTVQNIVKDKLKIKNKIDLNLRKDDSISLANSMSTGLTKFVKVFNNNNPDVVILLGDRYEIFIAAVAATLLRTPIGHIHGGEITKSLVDEAFRHSISKCLTYILLQPKNTKKELYN